MILQMEVNEIISKIEPIIKKSNDTFFSGVLTYLKSKYVNIAKDVIILDFSISTSFQRITITKENDYLVIELHKKYLEIDIGGYFLYFLSKEEYSKETIYLFLDNCFKGKFLLKVRKNQKNKIVFTKINWEDIELSIFNKEENKAFLDLKAESEVDQLGVNFLKIIN